MSQFHGLPPPQLPPQWVLVLALGWLMNSCLCTSTSFIYFRYLLPIPFPLIQSAHSMDMYICTVRYKEGNLELRYELHFFLFLLVIVFGKINCFWLIKLTAFDVKIIIYERLLLLLLFNLWSEITFWCFLYQFLNFY